MAVYRKKAWIRKPGTISAAFKAAMLARRAYNSYTKTQSKTQTSGTGVTAQYDAKQIYKRKRMPRYKRRLWRKFSNKVSYVIDKRLSTDTLLFNDADDVSALADSQGFSAWTMYGLNGTDSSGQRGNLDISRVFAALSTNAGKIIFKSAVLDMTFTNKGTFALEVDLYHVVYWNEGGCLSLSDAHTKAINETPVFAGRNPIRLTTRGATPFEMPQLLRKLRMKVLKKVKYFIGTNESTTYQLRDARNRQLSGAMLGNINTEFIQPGMTQGLIIVHKPVAGYQNQPSTLSVGCTRKYAFTSINENTSISGA